MNKIFLVVLFIFSISIAGFLAYDFLDFDVAQKEMTVDKVREVQPMFKSEKAFLEHKIEMLQEEIAFREEIIKELREEKSQAEKIQNLLLGLSALILNIMSIAGMIKKFRKAE